MITGLLIGDSVLVSASHAEKPFGEFTGVSPWSIGVVAEKLLNEKFGPSAYCLINKSVGGSGFGDWLYGNSAYGTIPFEQIIRENPHVDFIYVQLGINNAIRNGTASGVSYAVGEMHRIATNAGKRIIFGTPSPVNYPGRPEVNQLLYTFKIAIEEKCKQLGLVCVNQWNAAAASGIWPNLIADGIHPKEDYYRFMGHLLFLALANLGE